MSMLCCSCKSNCVGLSVIAGVIIGVVAAFLQITAAITVTPAFLWVVLGVAIVYLAIILLATSHAHGDGTARCLCPVLSTLLLGILGSALLAVVLLAITFPATSVLGAVLVGLLLFFFSLTISTTTCLVKCLAQCAN